MNKNSLRVDYREHYSSLLLTSLYSCVYEVLFLIKSTFQSEKAWKAL